MNLAELKEAYKARKLALDSAKKEEEKYKALLKDAMLEAGESDYTDEAGYRFERIVQERKSMDEEKLLAELHERNLRDSEVHILGTRYSIRIIDEDDYRYDREADGWCDPSVKEILIFNYKQSAESVKDLVAYQKKVLRHEIVHAFLYESGLWQNAYGSKCWAKNEEMIDWMAIQIPKIQRAYKEAYCDE